MEKGDIAPWTGISQATMFEGVLASPPPQRFKRFANFLREGVQDWEKIIPNWVPNELPVKSLYDCTNRRGIGTDVFTFLHPDAVEPIEKWLIRKGISVPVYWYPDVESLSKDFHINRAIRVLYTASESDAQYLGLRSQVVSPNSAWVL